MQTVVKRVFAVLVALCAIAVLVFLYMKNQEFSIDRQQNAIEALRDLRQLNADMDAGVLRANVGLVGDYDPISDTLIAMLATTERLGRFVTPSGQERALFEDLNAKVSEKTTLADQFKAENAVLRNSLRYLPTARDEVTALLAGVDGKHAAALTQIESHTANVFDALLRYSVFSDASVQGRVGGARASLDARSAIEEQLYALESDINALLEPLLARQKQEALSADEQAYLDALNQASAFVVHGKTVLRQKLRVDERMETIVSIPLLASIDQLNQAVQNAMEGVLQEADQYRLYLFGYAFFLLLVVFYFAVRLTISYRQVYVANRRLNEANETLELRVQERTVDLAKALEDLKQSESHLVQSEKMASLGQMVAGVAHEINTPLAYVRSTLETIESNIVYSPLRAFIVNAERLVTLMRTDTDDEALSEQFGLVAQALDELGGEGETLLDEMAGLIKDGVYGADQIKELVLNLRNFSRLDKERVAVFQVQDGLESSLMLAKNVVKNRNIVKRYNPIPPISCSPSQVNQVFLNIITNAVHATEEGAGTVTISTLQEDPDHVIIKIADNGKGIEPQHMSKLFDPFFTTKDVGKGTGLGLSIVYKIIKEHNGEIHVDSEIGKGTCFSIKLPVRQDLAAAA